MATTLRAAESGWTYTAKSDIVVIPCAGCGILFGITADYQKRRRADHEGFYCPNGHSNVYNGKSEEEKLREQLEWSRNTAARVAAERDQAQADARAQKAAKTRFKNQRDKMMTKIQEGQCPSCDLHFSNVREHMKHRHPEALAELDA